MSNEIDMKRRTLLGAIISGAMTGIIAPPAHALANSDPAPEISGDIWINSAPLRWADLRGRVVLVEFWTFECWNCHNVEPYIKKWHARYAAEGLQVLTVHAPEFDRERDPDNVRAYVKKAAITYPVVLDNDFVNWKRYDNHYWPVVYLIDKRGMLRHRKIGEGDYDKTESTIRALLAE